VEIRRIVVSFQAKKNVTETPSQPISRAWWHIPKIPATWKAVGWRIQIQAGPGKRYKTYPKHNQGQKGMGM
jgi:hypothetical protein